MGLSGSLAMWQFARLNVGADWGRPGRACETNDVAGDHLVYGETRLPEWPMI